MSRQRVQRSWEISRARDTLPYNSRVNESHEPVRSWLLLVSLVCSWAEEEKTIDQGALEGGRGRSDDGVELERLRRSEDGAHWEPV